MAITIKKASQIEIETNNLGNILLDHWSFSAIDKAEKMKSLKKGTTREFMEEFVYEFARKHDDSIEDKHEAYEKGKRISGLNEIPDQDLEKIAESYITSQINSLIPCISEKDGEYEKSKENNRKLNTRTERESHQQHLRRLISASLKGMRIHSKKIAEQFSSIAKKWQEPLLRNSRAISGLGMQINDIRSIEIPRIPVIQSPVHETNVRLKNISTQLEKLTLLTDAEIKQAELLNDKTTSLLEAAAESGEQAKKSVYIATTAIVLSVVMSLWSIIETRDSNQSTTKSLRNMINIQTTTGKELSSNISNLKDKLIEFREPNNDQSAIANNLNEIISVLNKIDKKLENHNSKR